MFLVIAFLIFGGAFLVAGYYVWAVPLQKEERLLAGRLRELRAATRARTKAESQLVRQEHRGSFAFLGDFVAWIGVFRRLQEYIHQADLKYRAADVVGVSAALFLGAYLVLGLFGSGLPAIRVLFSAAIACAPLAYISRVRGRRLKKFEENLPDAIDLFTRTMRAGHNIHSGLETMATETLDPVRQEFRKMMEELALGSPLEPALHNLGGRVPIIDLKFFITGLILQRQTGANMVAVLENLAGLIRERLNMAAKLKAHTAQQRFSAGLLCLLPVVVGLAFYILKRDYISLLWTDPTGSKFLTYAIISELLGILVIRKIADVRA